MPKFIRFVLLISIIFGLFACSNEVETAPQTFPAELPATPTIRMVPSQTPTQLQSPTATPLPITPSDPALYPLSEHGIYEFGKRAYTFNDANRDNRQVRVTVWYPAVRVENPNANDKVTDAPINLDTAPYPIILGSAKTGGFFAPHLVSHGFIFVGVNGMDSAGLWGSWLIEYPLDLVFALNQIADIELEGLAGMLDTDHVGVMGYSFDGYDALALSGARVDPEYYLSQCAHTASMDSPPAGWWVRYICEMTSSWDDFSALAGQEITSSADGLWQPITDDRILAVMPMAPEGAWLFGERGLAAVDRPTLITAGTLDHLNYYDLEASYIYNHINSSDRRLISFIGQDHFMIFKEEQVLKLRHFAAAFFGYYLQGNEDYFNFFSEKFVTQFDDLAWGIYP